MLLVLCQGIKCSREFIGVFQGINFELNLSLLVAVLILDLLDGLSEVVQFHILLLGLLRDSTEILLLIIFT